MTPSGRVVNEEIACEKMKDPYSHVGFAFFRDGLLAAARMRLVIGVYTFHNVHEKSQKREKIKDPYSHVGFAFFRDGLLAAPRMRIVIGIYTFHNYHE